MFGPFESGRLERLGITEFADGAGGAAEDTAKARAFSVAVERVAAAASRLEQFFAAAETRWAMPAGSIERANPQPIEMAIALERGDSMLRM